RGCQAEMHCHPEAAPLNQGNIHAPTVWIRAAKSRGGSGTAVGTVICTLDCWVAAVPSTTVTPSSCVPGPLASMKVRIPRAGSSRTPRPDLLTATALAGVPGGSVAVRTTKLEAEATGSPPPVSMWSAGGDVGSAQANGSGGACVAAPSGEEL